MPEPTTTGVPLPPGHDVPDWPPGSDVREDYGCIVSLDVGQQQDYSALVVLQRWMTTRYIRTDSGDPVTAEDRELMRDRKSLREDGATDRELGLSRHRVTSYGVIHAERLPLGTPFPSVVERTRRIMALPQVQGRRAHQRERARPAPVLVYDATAGIGGVRDLFAQAGLAPNTHRVWPIVLHGGDAVSHSGGFHRVPKRDVARLIAILLETQAGRTRRLSFSGRLAMLDVLVNELKSFRVRINLATGHDSYEAWREREHDDLVLAVGLGCWAGEKLEREPPGEFVVVRPMA